MAGRTTDAPKKRRHSEIELQTRQGSEAENRVIVAVGPASYKAPTDFVFFGRYKNDNNNERTCDRHRFVDRESIAEIAIFPVFFLC